MCARTWSRHPVQRVETERCVLDNHTALDPLRRLNALLARNLHRVALELGKVDIHMDDVEGTEVFLGQDCVYLSLTAHSV